MAKYLEIINDNNSVVLDDNFQCLEVINSVPLSQCVLEDTTSGGVNYHNYQYRLPFSTPENAIYGISISGLENAEYFSYSVEFGRLTFWDKNSKVNNVGFYGVARPDIVAHSTLYVFNVATRQASEHGVGLEVCNENGKVVFSSEAQYLNVLFCGSDEVKEFPATNAIVVILGYDTSTEYWQSHISGKEGAEYVKRPGFMLTNGTVKIGGVIFSMAYINGGTTPDFDSDGNIIYPDNSHQEDDWEYTFRSWLAYGWLVGILT